MTGRNAGGYGVDYLGSPHVNAREPRNLPAVVAAAQLTVAGNAVGAAFEQQCADAALLLDALGIRRRTPDSRGSVRA